MRDAGARRLIKKAIDAQNLTNNLFDKSKVTQGYYVSYSSGNLSALASYDTSDYIPVSENTNYSWNLSGQQISYSNSLKQHVSGLQSAPKTFTTPAGVAYVRLSIPHASLDTVMLVKGSAVPTTYVPYNSATYDVSAIKGKNVAILGDSIMMLMRDNDVKTNGVVDQTKLDNQDWNSLKTALGLNSLMNLGLGGATVYDKGPGTDTEYPQPDDTTGYTNYLTNEVRWLQRQVNSNGKPTPDCIIIWLGTNGAGEPSTDNYNTVMSLSYTDLMSEANRSIRQTFYGGLRASLEMLYRNFPNATIFIFSPIQTNPANYRTYDALTVTRDALKRMSDRYACVFVDALHEIGIVDFYENELNDGTSRFLGDGLHPNNKGRVLYRNYLSRRLMSLYYSKQ